MEIFSTRTIRTLMEEAERLGIEHGLSEQSVLSLPNDSRQRRYRRLKALIEERRDRAEEYNELRRIAQRWRLPTEKINGALIAEIQALVDEQRRQLGMLAEADDECSLDRSVASLAPLLSTLDSNEYDIARIPLRIVSGLVDLADLSVRHSILGYRDRPDALIDNQAYRDICFEQHRWTSTQVLLCRYDDYAIIAFRGTSNLWDGLIDAQGLRIGRPGRHLGFHRAWRGVSQPVRAWLEAQMANGARGVILTGHSLGGALAKLAAFELSDDFPVRAVTTFGAPRIGNAAFRRAYQARLGAQTWRFEYGSDLITWLVPRWAGYRHVGNRVVVWPGGELEFKRASYSTRDERNAHRAHIAFRPRVEQRIREQYALLAQEHRDWLARVPWLGIPAVNRSLVWLMLAYAGYKFASVFVWVARRFGHDMASHGKDQRYGYALADCASRVNADRWSELAAEECDKRREARRDWLRIGSSLDFRRPLFWSGPRK